MRIYIQQTTFQNPDLRTCRSLIFVDPLVWSNLKPKDREKYCLPSDPSTVRIFLSPFINGVEQIANILAQCPCAQSLYIHSTGIPGKLDLGKVTLSAANIERYAWELQFWFAHLPSYITPLVVLENCNTGDGIEGIRFIDQLCRLTGCHIQCLHSGTGRHLQLV